MLRDDLRAAVGHVGLALREPEGFALRWHRDGVRYGLAVWAVLGATSVLGTTAYGMTMGILGGPSEVLLSAVRFTVAAGLAWVIPLPALYILQSLLGSRLTLATTLLAALVTTSWGGLAMLASIPINWFFTVSVPEPWFLRLVNLVVFAGVGVAMIDVFGRVMRSLEPHRGRKPTWCLILVATIGTELFQAFGLFDFAVRG